VLIVLPGVVDLVSTFSSDAKAPTIVSGLGICAAYWIYRYVRGRAFGADGRKRKRFHSATSGLLFAAPMVLTLCCYGGESKSPLGQTNLLVAWTCVASVVLLSIVIRGHERKLHGVYVGQTRWLKENPDAMANVLPPPRAADA
jgi:hypothetical protein